MYDNNSELALSNFLIATFPFFTFINFISGLVGGVWLIVSGNWLILLGAIVITIITYKVFPFVNMPIGFFVIYFAEKEKRILCLIFSILNLILTFVFLGILLFTMFYNALVLSEYTSVNVIPFVLLGFSVVTTPFQYMASKERADSYATVLTVSWIQISYVILTALYYANCLWLAIPIVLIFAIVLILILSIFASKELN